jgi:hypothetical protein
MVASACGKVESSGAVSGIDQGVNAKLIAQCQSDSEMKGAKIAEFAQVLQLGKQITVNYHYTVSKDGKSESGSEKIVGNLDPVFIQTHDQDSLGLLLETATLTISEQTGGNHRETVKNLDKTEISRVADRLYIEESDIILKLTGCQFK